MFQGDPVVETAEAQERDRVVRRDVQRGEAEDVSCDGVLRRRSTGDVGEHSAQEISRVAGPRVRPFTEL